MKKIKLALALMFYVLLQIPVIVYANAGDGENHFVIIYDVSKTMESVDEDMQAADMISLFIDKIPQSQYPIKISVMPFSTNPEIIKPDNGDDWWYFKDENDDGKIELKNAIQKLKYDGDYTDIGQALEKCEEILLSMREEVEDYRQVVLFITDGYIDVADDEGKNNKFDNIVASYEKVKMVADSFPEDCCFLGIIPQRDSLSDKLSIIEEDGVEKVVTYWGAGVPKNKQTIMYDVIQAMNNFGKRLKERHPKKQIYKSTINDSIDMSSSNAIDEIGTTFKDFFDKIFDSTTITKEDVNLKKEYDFYVPEVVDEVIISIVPEGKDINKKRQNVKRIKDNNEIEIAKDNKKCDFKVDDSRSAITLKLIHPESGTYTLRSGIDIKITAICNFTSHGNLNLECDEAETEAVLGQPVEIRGKLVDSGGNILSNEESQSIQFWIRDLTDVSDDSQEENRKYIAATGESSFDYDYKPRKIGDNYITVGFSYDDTDKKNPIGVSSFSKEITPIHLIVPEVQYRLQDAPQTCQTQEEIELQVEPFSVIDGEEMIVSAAACKEYLQDTWTLSVNGGEEQVMNVNEENDSFTAKQVFTDKGDYNLVFTNGQETITQSIVVSNASVQLSMPESEILGNAVPIEIAFAKEKGDLEKCKLTIINEKGEVVLEETLEVLERSANYTVQPTASGIYQVVLEAQGCDKVEQKIEIINNAPQLTKEIPKVIKIQRISGMEECSKQIDTSSWFEDKEGHTYSIQFEENDIFDIKPMNLDSAKDMKVQITSKSAGALHWMKKNELSFTAQDQYGMKSQTCQIVVKETLPIWLVVILGVLGVAIILALISKIINFAGAVSILVYVNGNYFKSVRISEKNNYQKVKKIKTSNGKKRLTISYKYGKFQYSFEGRTHNVESFKIYLKV